AVDDMLNEFMRRHRQVTLELEASNRRFDIIGEGIDVALRVRMLPLDDSDLVMKKLGDSRQCLVAAPALLDALGRPRTTAALAQLPSLATRISHAGHQWRLRGPDGEEHVVEHAPRLLTDDMQALQKAALAGLGVVQLPTMVVRADLAAGRLER